MSHCFDEPLGLFFTQCIVAGSVRTNMKPMAAAKMILIQRSESKGGFSVVEIIVKFITIKSRERRLWITLQVLHTLPDYHRIW